jgi:hypothetical protein
MGYAIKPDGCYYVVTEKRTEEALKPKYTKCYLVFSIKDGKIELITETYRE